MTTPVVLIESPDNLHCPTCDARLVQPAGRYEVYGAVLGMPGSVELKPTGEPPYCPERHHLPDEKALRRYRRRHGYPKWAPVSVAPPLQRPLGRQG
jgi:hypothetical protein